MNLAVEARIMDGWQALDEAIFVPWTENNYMKEKNHERPKLRILYAG